MLIATGQGNSNKQEQEQEQKSNPVRTCDEKILKRAWKKNQQKKGPLFLAKRKEMFRVHFLN